MFLTTAPIGLTVVGVDCDVRLLNTLVTALNNVLFTTKQIKHNNFNLDTVLQYCVFVITRKIWTAYRLLLNKKSINLQILCIVIGAEDVVTWLTSVVAVAGGEFKYWPPLFVVLIVDTPPGYKHTK